MGDPTQTDRPSGLKAILPRPLWRAVRSLGTAVLTPMSFSFRSGHMRSSFANMAVAADGSALPWYTYPCIDFLNRRTYDGRSVLEFGAGQSSLWWAARAEHVTSLEGDADWHEHIRHHMPANIDLALMPSADRDESMAAVRAHLAARPRQTYDIIVIDGLWRTELVDVAFERVSPDGVIICDNSEGYDFQAVTKDRALMRVDFYGYSPGVVKRSCTSVFFGPDAFMVSPRFPIEL